MALKVENKGETKLKMNKTNSADVDLAIAHLLQIGKDKEKKEKRKILLKKYRTENAEYFRKYRSERKDYFKEYRIKHKEKLKKYHREYMREKRRLEREAQSERK